jgi:hypothetical protein
VSVLIASPVSPPVAEAAVSCPVPQRFWEGDRVVHWQKDNPLELQRFEAGWRPGANSPRVVMGSVEDGKIRGALARQALGRQQMRFVPRYVPSTDLLPGQPLKSWADLATGALDAEEAIPFVSTFGECRGFWSLRDMTAKRAGTDAALYVPAAIPAEQMREALAAMLYEFRAAVSFHRPSGRYYARYGTWGEREDGGRPCVQLRTFVYVLAAPDGR